MCLLLLNTAMIFAAPKTVYFNEIDPASQIRFLDKGPSGKTYGLRIQSPWAGGGELYINLPEHLERQGTAGILRWNDDANFGVTDGWVPAADGLSATLEPRLADIMEILIRSLAGYDTHLTRKDETASA